LILYRSKATLKKHSKNY